MLRVHNPTPPRVQPSVQVPVYPEYNHLTVWPTLAQLNLKIAYISRSVIKFNKDLPIHIRPGPNISPIQGLVAYVHSVAVPTSESPKHIGIFIGFGWFSLINIDTGIREDVREGTARLLRLMYKVGERFLNADVCLPERAEATHSSYMSFSPDSSNYLHPFQVGCYISTMANIPRYFIAIRVIKETPGIDRRTRHILSLSLIYYFMSFASLQLRDEEAI